MLSDGVCAASVDPCRNDWMRQLKLPWTVLKYNVNSKISAYSSPEGNVTH